jgi:hypothetical protein
MNKFGFLCQLSPVRVGIVLGFWAREITYYILRMNPARKRQNMRFQALQKLVTPDSRQFFYLLIIGIWILIQYLLGNRFYIFLIIAIFPCYFIFRSPNLVRLVVPVLAIVVLTTSLAETLAGLKNINLDVVQNPALALTDIFHRNSGQGVLPDKVQKMLKLLRKNNISMYKLSVLLNMDPLIHERIIESAWPIKMVPNTGNLLILREEIKAYPDCKLIEQNEDVALVRCH